MHFTSFRDFVDFDFRIRREGRFALDEKSLKFLRVFLEQVKSRVKKLDGGSVLYRCVKDFDEVTDDQSGGIDFRPAGRDRLFPTREFAFDGRVNSSGIPVLYLASTEITAISEVRPWIGDWVSVGTFKTSRNLDLVDLSLGHDRSVMSGVSFRKLTGEEEWTQAEKDQCVWNSIDSAFSRPTTKTDSGAEYAPTQLLSETLKHRGFDGVIYKSAFGDERGYNIALFDLAAADVI